MMHEAISRYLERLSAEHSEPNRVDRRYRRAEDWIKWSSHDWRGRHLGEDPQLAEVLSNRRVAILGEPGSGKSTAAHSAVELAGAKGCVPVFVALRSYDGNLRGLVERAMTTDVAREVSEDSSLELLVILDGFDEVPGDKVVQFLADLSEVERDERTRILLTSRQAFFTNRRDLFRNPLPAFYLLDLQDEDIDRLIVHAGVERSNFRRAAEGAQLSFELANPLALKSFLRLFADTGGLGQTRSAAVGHVVRATLETNPTSDPTSEVQALRMLALAMETAARNELSEEEAKQVLQRTVLFDEGEAVTFLDELSRSILIRTQNGYAFQMRSYGEYLAATELADGTDLERLLEPMFLGETREPHDSWRNAVSYLVEQSTAARRYFTRRHPDWLLSSSPTLFSETQRTSILRTVVSGLQERQEFLLHHPLIRAAQLGRFVTPASGADLRAALGSADDVAIANAILVLGAHGDRDVASSALALALDPARPSHVRHSALAALDRIGSSDMIPALLAVTDWAESSVTSRIDTASALMDVPHTRMVLEALGQTDTFISSAFTRFDDLSTREEIDAILDALLTMRGETLRGRLHAYLDRIWPRMVAIWREEWVPKVADLIEKCADAEGMTDASDDLARALLKLPDGGAAVGRKLLDTAVREGRAIRGFPRTVPQLISLEDVRTLVASDSPDAREMVSYLQAFGATPVREFLFALRASGQDAKPREAAELTKWERRQKDAEARKAKLLALAVDASEPRVVLDALLGLEASQWPDLAPQRIEKLTSAVNAFLPELNLPQRIVWTTESSWTMPQVLSPLLRIVDRYELRLSVDVPLAEALRAGERDAIVNYFKRHGFTPAAMERVEQIAADPATPEGALDGVISFIDRAPVRNEGIAPILESIVFSGRSDRNRHAALHALCDIPRGLATVAARLTELNGELLRAAEAALIEQQHRPTIERRLKALLKDPSCLDSGNVELPHESPLAWIQKVRIPETWPRLEELRRLAMKRNLPNTTGVISGAMAAIDQVRLAATIRKQMTDTPDEWKPYQRIRAVEHEREGKILAAQSTSFEKVLDRIELYSSSGRYKFWVEGPTDVPAYEALLKKMPGGVKIRVQPFGGWNTILANDWSPRGYGDGCSAFLFLFDGDRAYDWAKPGRPLKPDVKHALAKLDKYGVEYHILDRYALENYFPRQAFETILGVSLARRFPLDEKRPVNEQGLPGYSKHRNVDLAAATTLADLAGTDLGHILDEAINWVSNED